MYLFTNHKATTNLEYSSVSVGHIQHSALHANKHWA